MAHDQQGYDETNISDYAENSYLDLKSGKFVVRLGSDRFRCPFCPGKKKQDYHYNELLEHAVGVGASNHAAKVKANHQALAKLLKEDHADAAATLPSRQAIVLSNLPKPVQDQDRLMTHYQQRSAMDCSSDESSELSETDIDDYAEKSYLDLKSLKFVARLGSHRFRCPFCPGKKKQDYHYNELLEHAVGVGASNHAAKVKANHQALAKLLKEDHADAAATLPPQQAIVLSNPPKPAHDQEVFVWPLMGILTNVPAEETQDNGLILMEQLADFKPVKVTAVYGANGYTGYVIALFTKDLMGFKNALAFDKYFKSQRLGKLEWEQTKQHVKYVFGWLAKEEDYKSDDPIGRFLSDYGDLKNFAKLEQGTSSKKRQLPYDLEEIKGFSELLPAKKLKSTSSFKVSEQGSKEATDVVRRLPNDLWWSVLSCYLSVYDAAKSATVSKDFLSVWRSYPQLSFTLGKNPSLHMLRAIGSILQKHDDQSIQSCFFHGFFQNVSKNLDNWLQILNRKSSKNFSLEIYSRSVGNLPNSVFDMRNISQLRLHQCVICAPDIVELPGLSKLSLKYCSFPEILKNDLQRFISACPNCIEIELVNNTLPETAPYMKVDINQLLLKDLSIEVQDMHTTWTVHSEHLSYAKIKVPSDLDSHLLQQVKYAERLSLSAMEVSAPITFQFDKLVHLTLDLFMNQNSMTAVFNMLEHAPYLKYFEIEFNDMGWWKEPELFWEERQSRSFPPGLEVVHVKGFTGTDLSADFLKFVASRPSVEKITVTLDPNIHVTGYGNAIRVLDMLREEYPCLDLEVFGEDKEEQEEVI